MNKKEAKEITGGLSAPGKMPEGSYNLPASACVTGAKLREIPGTPCYGCYAFKGRYKVKSIFAGMTQGTSRAWTILKKFFKYVI
jgi:hypothetical protein